MKKTVTLIFLLFAPAGSFAESYGGSSSMFLSDDPSATGFSAGGLALPLYDDPGAAYVNPGLLGRMGRSAASLSFWKGVDGISNYAFLSGILKTEDYGAFSLSCLGYSSGEEEIYDINGSASDLTLQKDYAVSAGWGRSFQENISFGLKVKNVNSELAEEYSANTFAFDLGVALKVDKELSAAISVENLNGKLKYKSAEEPLPRNVRFEMAQNIQFRHGALNAGIGIKKETGEEYLNFMGGAEWLFKSLPLALRGGLRSEKEGLAFNAGLGIMWKQFSLVYGMQFPERLGNSAQRITLSFHFDDASGAAVSKKPKKEKSGWEKKKPSRKTEKKKSGKKEKEDKGKSGEYWDGWFIMPQ